MAPRFFFDVSDGGKTISDEDGIEAADLDEALTEARSVIADMADEVVQTDPDQSWILIVRDETGAVVGRLPIK